MPSMLKKDAGDVIVSGVNGSVESMAKSAVPMITRCSSVLKKKTSSLFMARKCTGLERISEEATIPIHFSTTSQQDLHDCQVALGCSSLKWVSELVVFGIRVRTLVKKIFNNFNPPGKCSRTQRVPESAALAEAGARLNNSFHEAQLSPEDSTLQSITKVTPLCIDVITGFQQS